MKNGKGDAEKTGYWQKTIREAVRSGMSIREFCRRRRLKESRFYWWQRKLKVNRGDGIRQASMRSGRASFPLVSDEPGMIDAGIELVPGDGCCLRIRQGVEEETLQAVLAALEPSPC